MVFDVLMGLRVLAMSYANGDVKPAAPGSGPGTTVAPPLEPSEQSMSMSSIAGLVGCTGRAVRRAASAGRLRGVKNELGWWMFQRDDVAVWAATRTKDKAA